jgi:hypothetical protein
MCLLMWHGVVWYICTDLSEGPGISIVRVDDTMMEEAGSSDTLVHIYQTHGVIVTYKS